MSRKNVNSVIRNMGLLSLGTSTAKMISFLVVPLLTRMYGPEEFGALSLFLAMALILMPVITLRYSHAIPLPETDSDAKQLTVAVLLISTGATLFLFLFLLIFRVIGFDKIGLTELESVWFIFPIFLLSWVYMDTLGHVMTRFKRFKILAVSQILEVAVGSAVKILLFGMGFINVGLLLGQTAQVLAGFSFLYFKNAAVLGNLTRGVKLSTLSRLLFKYKDFPFYGMPAEFLFVTSLKIPVMYFYAEYDLGTAGQLGLALTVIALPATLIGQTLGKAYYAEISALVKQKDCNQKIYAITLGVLSKVAPLGVIAVIGFYVWGEQAFSLVFGAGWEQAGRMAAILSIVVVFQLVATPVLGGLMAIRRQGLGLFIHVVRFSLVVTAFAVSSKLNLGPEQSIQLYALIMVLVHIFSTCIVLATIKKYSSSNLSITNG